MNKPNGFLQKLKVNVLLANRKSGKLLFSVKPKEKEELVEKKRSLMVRGYLQFVSILLSIHALRFSNILAITIFISYHRLNFKLGML